MSVKFTELPEFKKDLKKIKANIEEDLNRFKKALETDFKDFSTLKQALDLNEIPGLSKKGVNSKIFKARKFRCKALNKGSQSGIRVIMMIDFECEKVEFVEMYSKNKKENHDEARIITHYKEQ